MPWKLRHESAQPSGGCAWPTPAEFLLLLVQPYRHRDVRPTARLYSRLYALLRLQCNRTQTTLLRLFGMSGMQPYYIKNGTKGLKRGYTSAMRCTGGCIALLSYYVPVAGPVIVGTLFAAAKLMENQMIKLTPSFAACTILSSHWPQLA